MASHLSAEFDRLARRALHLRPGKALRVRQAGWGALCAGGSCTALAAVASTVHLNADDTGPAHGRTQSFTDFGHEKRRATDIIMVINALCYALQLLSQDSALSLTLWGAKVNSLIASGQLWRLITPAYLHSSVLHLLVNSYALNSFGPHVELVAGSQRFSVLYLTSAFTGTLASYALTSAPSLGASGAIFGLGAALAMFYWRHKPVLQGHSDSMLRSLATTMAINLVFSLLVKNLDNWGHLGGLLGGAAASWLLGPRLVRSQAGRFVDRPPLPWLAFPEGNRFGSHGGPSMQQQLAVQGRQGGPHAGRLGPGGGRGAKGEAACHSAVESSRTATSTIGGVRRQGLRRRGLTWLCTLWGRRGKGRGRGQGQPTNLSAGGGCSLSSSLSGSSSGSSCIEAGEVVLGGKVSTGSRSSSSWGSGVPGSIAPGWAHTPKLHLHSHIVKEPT